MKMKKKDLEAIQKKVDQKIKAIERACKSLRHTLHELEEDLGLKPLGGGGSDK